MKQNLCCGNECLNNNFEKKSKLYVKKKCTLLGSNFLGFSKMR